MDDTVTATHVGADTDIPAPSTATDSAAVDADLLDDELLVEEISIDGMCGVY